MRCYQIQIETGSTATAIDTWAVVFESDNAADHVGKTAYFGRYAGMLVEEGGKQLRLIDAQEIRGVV